MKIPLKKSPEINHRSNPSPQRRDDHSNKSFNRVMADTTHAMPKYQRYFSHFIHMRTVWLASDALSRTIARPNAVLFGAILSFVVTVGVYLLSKNFGYNLSGFESIGAFLVGWIAGIVFDVSSSLLRRKK